jgi:hypothetical protein
LRDRAGEVKDAIDQFAHAIALGAYDPRSSFPALIVQFFLVLVGDYLAESVDCPQWGAQVVRDRVAEGLEFLVDLGQFIGGG